MTVQELSKALSPMGYVVEDTEDVVRITIDPSDFIRGAPKLQKDLEKVGWRRSYSYRASRPLTKAEAEAWDRHLHPLDYLEPLAYPKMPKVKKPKRTEPVEEYVQLSLF
jgi:hypothetical protein